MRQIQRHPSGTGQNPATGTSASIIWPDQVVLRRADLFQLAMLKWPPKTGAASCAVTDRSQECSRTFAGNHSPFHAGQLEIGVAAGKMNPPQCLATPFDGLGDQARSNFRKCTGGKRVAAQLLVASGSSAPLLAGRNLASRSITHAMRVAGAY